MIKVLLVLFASVMSFSHACQDGQDGGGFCNYDPNGQKAKERNLADFNEVEVSNSIDLYLKQGNETKAVIEVDGIALDRVVTEVSGRKLRICIRKSNNFRTVKVYLTYKSLQAVSASSSSAVYSESLIRADDLKIEASSSASMELNIDVNSLKIEASSSADMELSGKAVNITGSATSSGDVDAFDLVCKTADVKVSSSGSIKINVTNKIKARASSSGSVRYKGNPPISNTDSSSGGSVHKY